MSTAFSRVTTAPFVRLVPLVLLGGISVTAILRAAEPPPPASGEVRLASGRVVDFTIHFDRNSLRDSLRVGDGLIALTSSGALLRFELPAVRLASERIDVEVACIGRGQGEAVLAGLPDGRVCRVDLTTLELKEVVKLPAAPHWVGWCEAIANRPAGVIGITRTTRPMERDGEHGTSRARWSMTSPLARRFRSNTWPRPSCSIARAGSGLGPTTASSVAMSHGSICAPELSSRSSQRRHVSLARKPPGRVSTD